MHEFGLGGTLEELRMGGGKDFLVGRVEALEVIPNRSIDDLLRAMGKTGFQGRRLSEAVDVITEMITDEDVTVLMGYAGSLSVAGQWKIIKWFIENGFIDVLVPTGANISEDIVEAMGHSYYQLGGKDDPHLFREGYNRYFDLCGAESDYFEMTSLIAEFICDLVDAEGGNPCMSSREFLRRFGEFLDGRGIDCIVSAAYRHDVDIFCPAIVDSPYGDAILMAYGRGRRLRIDNAADYIEFMSMAERVRETGVIYVGGGVPKDFIQLFAVTPDLMYDRFEVPGRRGLKRKGVEESFYPHKYAVQITTDSPQWGGLSGATLEEGISWGKELIGGRMVTVYCDATIALPIIAHAIAERLGSR